MSTYQIPAPPPMSLKGDVVENWKDFENSWHYFMIATDLRSKLKKDDGTDNPEGMEIVAATLCCVMGPECIKVMNSLPSLSEEDKKKPARIIEELQKQFVPQQNVLYERVLFNSAIQKSNESVDEYVLRLRQLSESCEFGTFKDSLIRDRIVVGTSDEAGRERLFREQPVPNLDKVIESLRAAEISRIHKFMDSRSRTLGMSANHKEEVQQDDKEEGKWQEGELEEKLWEMEFLVTGRQRLFGCCEEGRLGSPAQ
ncbi:uncharacterized protein LOC143031338 [Oratosquilla oratoria]|uniref:uncharacterized protein LOC143031338 n=1 Tax=Oratosquilla oratoria TaxID=337810 RepID=UPI003F76AA39